MDNYSFGIKPIPDVENGHTFVRDNFTQMIPHTKILEGKTGLKFINCNLTNCDIPPDAVCEGSRPKHGSFCSHIHPEWVEHGLTVCVENCQHVVDTDVITVDGVSVGTIYHYDDKAVD